MVDEGGGRAGSSPVVFVGNVCIVAALGIAVIDLFAVFRIEVAALGVTLLLLGLGLRIEHAVRRRTRS